ncbi:MULTISPECIES: mechanosensitive ion channel domain-containing protein [unclassified Microcoleus]|uniref:mechanosensitive ion channel domain-containing protein n=1 Tax=unclassified Microcoleus TaxID=2642155 RepID=UPI002FD3CFAF
MSRYKIRAIILTAVVCVAVVWTTPVRSQEQEQEQTPDANTPKLEQVEPEKPADPKAATTTKDFNIPVDELKILVKPLTLEELRNEAAAWMLVLQKKAHEISEAEVTIKRQNQAISQQQEGVDALEKAKKALEAAEQAQKGAAPGSRQYEEGTKKVEEAKESLKKAQSAVEKSKTTKAELKQDETSNKTLEKAQKTGDLETAKQTLDKIKADRDKTVAGSLAYSEATKTIEKLEAAIKAFESAQEAQKGAEPESPEYQEATQQLEEADEALKQLLKDIGATATGQSSQDRENATAAVENTEIKNNGEEKVAGSPAVVNNQQNLQQKEQELKKTTENLQKSTDADSAAKNQLVVTVTELQSQLTAIDDRFNAILEELEKKGGDPKPYRQYTQAVMSIDIDTKDTQGLGVRLLAWAKAEEGGMRWVGNTGKFVGIVIVSIVVSQILGAILYRLMKLFGGTSRIMRQFIVMLVKRGGVVVGFLVALTALEVSLGPVLALVGGLSFILAFALQSNLGNIASGLMIMAYKPFDVGDEIKLGELWGWVESITLANTKIKGLDGQMFNVPNNTVWGDTIENLSHSDTRKFTHCLRIGFEEDLGKVEQLLVEILKSHPKVLAAPAPSTQVWSIEDYYISLKADGWVNKEDFWTVHSDAIRMIRQRFYKEGIQLAAIPKSMDVGEPDNSNGNISYLVSETSVHRGASLLSDIPKD